MKIMRQYYAEYFLHFAAATLLHNETNIKK